jgi:hypothetical protein
MTLRVEAWRDFPITQTDDPVVGLDREVVMRVAATILLAVGLTASSFVGGAAAPGGHGGGGGGHIGGGGHFGGGGRGYLGGGYGYGYGLGFGLGLGLGALYYGYPYWGGYAPNDYYDSYGGYDPYYAPDAGYPPPPPPSGADMSNASQIPTAARPSAPYWYHCDNPEGYYPYVKTCGTWQAVPATPPPPPPRSGSSQ